MPSPFLPPPGLRSPHLQTTLASLFPRKLASRARTRRLRAESREHILDCGQGVRLSGAFSPAQQPAKGLVTLLHGWEGSMDSAYLLSAAGVLYQHGYSIFRLNLRDHGHSHHLNRELFNSNRLTEVVRAVAEIQGRFPHERTFLVGFSLGGNFALRIGLEAPAAGIHLNGIATVSPLINPQTTTDQLEAAHPLYHHYFVRKWKRSLHKKHGYFPELGLDQQLLRLNSLSRMHDHFVPRHTDHATTREYLASYRLSPARLQALTIPSHLIGSKDDPITLYQDLAPIQPASQLQVEVVDYGGHCGFLQDYRLTSWADNRLKEILDAYCG
ncbi:YheT family hydrolase [Desulfogranum mediterraneum]|uniref:YheT family hydrolase n=1 Tax=Desulfogranum mediterraneum TaxID=160661 RepID=UPI0004025381|nr:alpha/beta fold hydrolase [Desulfogranum mediterraneum]